MKKAHLILAGLLLSFTLNAANDIPRPEYPRPQFERSEWINLNGEWTYEFDFSNSGRSRRLTIAKQFSNTITVPFCPESKLSGVNYTDLPTSHIHTFRLGGKENHTALRSGRLLCRSLH